MIRDEFGEPTILGHVLVVILTGLCFVGMAIMGMVFCMGLAIFVKMGNFFLMKLGAILG